MCGLASILGRGQFALVARDKLLLILLILLLESLQNTSMGSLERLNLLNMGVGTLRLEHLQLLGMALLQGVNLGDLLVLALEESVASKRLNLGLVVLRNILHALLVHLLDLGNLIFLLSKRLLSLFGGSLQRRGLLLSFDKIRLGALELGLLLGQAGLKLGDLAVERVHLRLGCLGSILSSFELGLGIRNLGLEGGDLGLLLLLLRLDLVIVGRLQSRLRRSQLVNLLLELSSCGLVAGLEFSQSSFVGGSIRLVLIEALLVLGLNSLDGRGLLSFEGGLELLNLGSMLFNGLLECFLAGAKLLLALSLGGLELRLQRIELCRTGFHGADGGIEICSELLTITLCSLELLVGLSDLALESSNRGLVLRLEVGNCLIVVLRRLVARIGGSGLLANLLGELCNLLLGGLDLSLEGLDLGFALSKLCLERLDFLSSLRRRSRSRCGVAAVVRETGVRVAEAVGVAAVRLAVAVRGVVVAEDGGLRVAVVEPAVPTVRLSAVLAGLDMIELVLRADATEEVVDFLSSSLALMLGRLRWLDMDVAVGGRRTVEAAGRVGGLARPPGARVVLVEVVGLAVEEIAPGRRVAVVEGAPGCLSVGFAPGLSFAFSLTGDSGDEGVAAVLGLSGSGSGSVVAAASD
ncbi:hypothetical protein HG531_008556 [Fusarium graminearum]|nr:hypothetical protein HG531_008556 [Fusarium graminearum]